MRRDKHTMSWKISSLASSLVKFLGTWPMLSPWQRESHAMRLNLRREGSRNCAGGGRVSRAAVATEGKHARWNIWDAMYTGWRKMTVGKSLSMCCAEGFVGVAME